MSLCEYKDIFGKPREGSHSYRVLNIAIVDVFATFLLAGVLSRVMSISIILVFIILVIISIPIHKMFCVDTTLSSWVTNS
jgi:hypothetical protein